jgi:predicted AlkP superfamily pyrophosphatase or phosphodiesterase
MQILKAKTFYDLAHDAGMTTAQVGWVPGQTDGTITWGFGEAPDPQGSIEQEMAKAGTLTETDLEEVGKTTSPVRDNIWFKVATHVISQHRPSVLLIRFTDLDAIYHKFGSSARETQAAVLAADGRVAGILDAINKAGLQKRSTVFVVSDQGFKTAQRNIRPNAALRSAGLLSVQGPKYAPKVVSADAHAVTAGGTASVFITTPDRRDEMKKQVKKILGALEGVEQVVDPSKETTPGYPRPGENPQTGDLILQAKPGYGFIAAADGEPVSDVSIGMTIAFHGYSRSDPDMAGIFIAWGRGIRPGAQLGKISNLDVAPTIARILDLKMESAEGRALSEILK